MRPMHNTVTCSPVHLFTCSWLIFAFCCGSAQALAHTQQSPHNHVQPNADIPWPAKLGLRSHAVSAAVPLIDRVVLVPDAATYVDELAKWSLRGRWPVLIEDDVLAPMFVRRFKPAQVVRRPSIQNPEGFHPSATQLDAIIIRAFGGDPAQHTVRDAFAAQQYAPPGVVIASLDDPAWTAAIALAAGRGQPIAWMTAEDGSFGSPNDELDDAATQRLMATVDRLVAEQKYPYQGLGDEIDTLTICRSMAVKTRAALSRVMKASVGGPSGDGPVAVTDVLGRNADGTRYAIVGWIFGSETRAAYMAMCSLFLTRDRVTLFNTYPAGNPWDQYSTAPAASLLQRNGFTVQHTHGQMADERGWLRSLIGGWSTDVALINTKGNCDFFDLNSGSASPLDVPMLNEPVALHLIHSWSMQFPARLDTVGAQWIERGAYAAVGSCHEPYLAAFLPLSELSNRFASFVPFLVSARWWDGQSPLSKPWRVVTIGDPLMLAAPPVQVKITRITQSTDDGLDLNEHVKVLMREAADDPTGMKFKDAIAVLSLMGKDDIAVGLWRVAARNEVTARAASRAALEPLFRMRDVDEFLRCWDHLPSRDIRATDILWHLLSSRLAAPNGTGWAGAGGTDVVFQLQSAIRQPFPQFDLQRLAPHLVRLRDKAHARSVIQREMQKTNSASAQRALAELANQY